jgi:O-antigen ligase
MDLQNLKTNWSKMNYLPKNDIELEKMTSIKNHPVFKKIKTKLIIETLAISLFLLTYHSGFDGDKKPLYANILLVFSAITYIINGLLSLQVIKKPIQGENLRESIYNYYKKVKTISKISLSITIVYTASLLLFFGSAINFREEKKWILLFGFIVLIQLLFLSSRIWKSWLEKLKIEIENFN